MIPTIRNRRTALAAALAAATAFTVGVSAVGQEPEVVDRGCPP